MPEELDEDDPRLGTYVYLSAGGTLEDGTELAPGWYFLDKNDFTGPYECKDEARQAFREYIQSFL